MWSFKRIEIDAESLGYFETIKKENFKAKLKIISEILCMQKIVYYVCYLCYNDDSEPLLRIVYGGAIAIIHLFIINFKWS
jgi:hypothetical protein